jgi:hypothetical protein
MRWPRLFYKYGVRGLLKLAFMSIMSGPSRDEHRWLSLGSTVPSLFLNYFHKFLRFYVLEVFPDPTCEVLEYHCSCAYAGFSKEPSTRSCIISSRSLHLGFLKELSCFALCCRHFKRGKHVGEYRPWPNSWLIE